MGPAFRFALRVVVCVGTLLLVTGGLCAQDAPANPAPSTPQFGIPEDWSTSHVIYTRNGSLQDMMAVRGDPRFLHSFLLHNIREHNSLATRAANGGLNENDLSEYKSAADHISIDTDDFPIQNSQNSEEEKKWHHHHRLRHDTRSKVDWAVSLGPTSGMAFGESPAKYSFNPSQAPTCSDFVVYTIAASGNPGTQANLIGLTNLYTNAAGTGFCAGTGPTFLFSYAIGTGLSDLSPVLSLDGTKVAWLETRGGNTAYLHVTTWATGTGQGTNATTGSVAVNGASSDIAISYTNLAVTGCTSKLSSNGDSDLYVDYTTDTGFVSSDNGNLYHISGIFKGTPTFDFCIAVNNAVTANAMSGTVYDQLLKEVFISDSKTLYGYTVGASSYTLAGSYVYGNGSPNDVGPGPMLDTFNGFVYMFTTHDKNDDTSMVQFPVALTAGSAVFVPLGPASTNDYLFFGAFDNNYYVHGPTNANATIYSCGTDSTTKTAQDLFAISFLSTGLANTTPAMSANKNVNPGGNAGLCSPITEFFDGTTDRIFVGMGDNTAATGANVVTMWNVTSRLTNATATPTASAINYIGGTTGFTIDNNASGTAQAESIYFSTLDTSGAATTCGAAGTKLYCAVKLTQSLLQ